MFGYVLINKPELKIKEFDLYHSYYCGVCRSLKKYGLAGRLTLNYDMTFLAMLLSDLYDKEDCVKCGRCIVHPKNKHDERVNEFSDYCADMCVYLAYYKCADDYHDTRKFKKKLEMLMLSGAAKRVRSLYPQKTSVIEKKLNMLSIIENANDTPSDRVATLFGEIMAEAFVYADDFWKEDLYKLGMYLGKYIYLLDAYEDVPSDIKSGEYNPFKAEYEQAMAEGKYRDFDTHVREMLTLMIGEATDAFERLPLIENVAVLRNILYSGVWIRYNKVRDERINNENKDITNGSI